MLYREEEREMIPYCNATGVGYFSWSFLGAGVLAHAWDDRSDAREGPDPYLKMLSRSSEHGAEAAIVERNEKLAKEKWYSMRDVVIELL